MTIRKPWSFVLLGLLAVSLLVNCAVGGFAVMRAMDPPFKPGDGRMLAGLLRPFPEPLRTEIRDRLKSDRDSPETRAVFAEIRSARLAFMNSLRAPEFDRTAVNAAASRLDAAVSTLNRRFSTAVIDTIAEANADVRARIEVDMKPPKGMPGGAHGPPPEPPPGTLFAPPPPDGPPPAEN